MKKIIICIAVILCLSIGITIFNMGNLKSSCFPNQDIQAVEMLKSNDVYLDEGEYVVNGEDAYFVYQVTSETKFLNGIIRFEEALQEEITLQVFYADSETAFKSEKSYFLTKESGNDYIIFELPDENIKYIRIDIAEAEGYLFTIENIFVAERTVENYLDIVSSLHNLGIVALIISCGLIICAGYKNRKVLQEKAIFLLREHQGLITIFLLIIVAIGVHWKYIFGGFYYVFYDVASDSMFQTFPSLLDLADRIQAGEWGVRFNFSQGLGKGESSLVITLANWVSLFGREYVGYLMGISIVLKIVLSGIFAYNFSNLYGNKKQAGLLVAFGYAFSAPIIMRGGWESYPNIALLLMIWLNAYEYAHRKKKVVFLPIATVLFFYGIGIYECVFWGGLLAVYILFREIADSEEVKVKFSDLFKQEVIYVIFAVLGMADTIAQKFVEAISSSRFTGNTSNFSDKMEEGILAGFEEVTTGFLRTIGMTINGISGDYKGYNNFLEAPAFYCGILTVVLIPISLYNMSKKKRNLYILGYVAAILYTIIRPLRYIANGFAGFTYKLSSLWIMILMVLTLIEILKKIFLNEPLKEKSCKIFNVTILAIIAWLGIAFATGMVSREDSWLFSLLFVIGYGILINFFIRKESFRTNIKYILCLVVVLEVVFVSWDCVNDRKVLVAEEEKEGYYNDSTAEIVDTLRSNASEWFRVEKQYMSVYLCDSLAQEYYGTQSYVGGTEIGEGVLSVYSALGLAQNGNHYLYGSGGNIYADALLGVKYLLTREDDISRYNYSYVDSIEETDVYENNLALPLAYAYEDSITENEFLKYSIPERNQIILKKCVVDSEENSDKEYEYLNKLNLEKCDTVYKKHVYKLKEDLDADVLVVEIEMENNEFGTIYCSSAEGSVVKNYFSADDKGESQIELYMKDLESVWFDENTEDLIDNVKFYYQNAEEYYADAVENIENLQDNAMQITSFKESYIEGTINCKKDMLLATSIPYDKKWNIQIDGKPVEVMKVNMGFIGTELSAGEHEVVISYGRDSWIAENKFKCIGFILAVIFMTVGIISDKKGRKQEDEKNISSSSRI